MKRLDRIWRRGGPPAPPPPEQGQALPSEEPEELFDRILGEVGFDTEHPHWTEPLRRLHRHTRRRRLQVVPDFFYTSVFAPADLPAEVWDGTFPSCGTFDLNAQREFLKATPSFARSLSSLPFEATPSDSLTYHWGNDQFSHSDASIYYSMIRRFQPGRIIEVGAGHSTKLAFKAVGDNGHGRVLCIDPHAPHWLSSFGPRVEILAEPVQQVPESVFHGLGPSDILFIDGSHISKTGSDVNHLFLRVLPTLPSGVLVHIHDICLPYEYPRRWSEETLCYWNEQYVLAALLANSKKFEILVGVYFLQMTDIASLKPFVPEITGVFPGGGSLWMRSREDT